MNKFIGFRVLKFFVLIFFILYFSIASGQTGNINIPSHDNAVILGSRYSIDATHNISESDFIRGADISTFPQIDAFGGKFSVNGKTTNLLDILSDNGVNYIRLRLWHTPRDWYCGLESTLEIAKKVKAHGFKLLLDFHYSDWWADPANQKKPAAWEKLPFALLKDSVYAYTYRVISLLKAEDALPDMVQIGNEISPGMLFPDGAVSGSTGWQKLAQLLNSGISAVHSAANNTNTAASANSINGTNFIHASGNSAFTHANSTDSTTLFIDENNPITFTDSGLNSIPAPVNPISSTYSEENSTPAPEGSIPTTLVVSNSATSTIKIMLHLDSGGDNAKCRWWFDHILAQDVRFDIIGLSYYPWWHGTLNDLKNNMNDLAIRYNKDILVVETAYPMTNKYLNDGMDNVGFDEQKLIPGYPVSVKGQTDFLFTLKNLIKDTANKRGIGFIYWEPAWIWQKPFGTAWEYFTLFDPVSGEMLPSLEEFIEDDSTATGIDEGTFENGNPQFPQDPNNPKYPGANAIPTDIVLYQNYPNPFNPTTIIQYYLPEPAYVSLKIYDLLGREVGELVNDTQSAGLHRIALNADQHHLTSGVYIYSITISPNSDGMNPTPRTISKAMILVK